MKRKLAVLAFAVAASMSFNSDATVICTTNNPDLDGEGMTVRWYVGDPRMQFHGSDGNPYSPGDFLFCDAWGAELDYIRNNFVGVPVRIAPRSTGVIWRGDNAYFLFENLGMR